jgi:hypothetical protein
MWNIRRAYQCRISGYVINKPAKERGPSMFLPRIVKYTNTEQANKLLATEMDFWRRSARKSRKEKVRNGIIREIMEVGENILEVTEEKRLR